MLLRFLLIPLLAVWLTLANACAQSDTLGLYLTWQHDPTTTMTVNWVNLYEHTPTSIWYRPEGTQEWQAKTGTRGTMAPSTMQVRRVELTGLKPGTTYEFSLAEKAPVDKKGVEKFRTMPVELIKPLRFVSGGDMMHSREYVDEMNKQAARLDPDFALLGGDLAYSNNTDAARWIDWLQSWTKLMRGKGGRLIPMVVAIGNHEVRGGYKGKIPDDASHFYSLFALPSERSYYALDFGKYLSLLILDSGHTQPIAGTQADWLKEALATRSGQQFLFPCYHFPAYGTAKASKQQLPCDTPRAVEIRTNWLTHIDRYGVSAVFENDNHNYKRTYRIRNHQRDDENGILYLGDGAWGVKTRTVPEPGEAWYLAKAEPRRHLYSVTLQPQGRADIEAVDVEGKVFDHVTLETARTKPVP